MGKKKRTPTTLAVRALRQAGVDFGEHLYAYEHKGGTRVSSRELGVAEHAVVKTLVMCDERAEPLIVLMHGDCSVSTKALAREIGAKSVSPCDPAVAVRHPQAAAGLRPDHDPRARAPVHQRRGPRLPGEHDAR